ncbi:hypothetical protein HFO93_21000 [Rhizobium leguminosarum]|uniref:hypothetical protein n=1 Tax=Rhizobium leguminosarum TaxID=384 RepID=UPI001C989B2C|nr:hypothetical protein [Rhizobium leguminosarum]MBY5445912.1 hypothetical protein [Rhizobium leguminosarum]
MATTGAVAVLTSPGAFAQTWLKRHQSDDVQYDLEYPPAHRYLSFASYAASCLAPSNELIVAIE